MKIYSLYLDQHISNKISDDCLDKIYTLIHL